MEGQEVALIVRFLPQVYDVPVIETNRTGSLGSGGVIWSAV